MQNSNDVVWQYNGVEFKRGDKVRIVRLEAEFAPNGMGEGVRWENTWPNSFDDGDIIVRGMDAFIGCEYEINDIDETGVYFVEDEDHNNSYGYPLSALENISVKEAV